MREKDATQERLVSYLKGGRIHPAIILAGPDRDAKFQIAKDLAKVLLCSACRGNGGLFCGKCSACRRIESEIHPDVLILREPEEDTLKIEGIRELCHQMEISPIEEGAKICIVDECHRMTAAAANAFLKTLEEPRPGRYFWLLTTQAASLLPTILSRSLCFTFKPESPVEAASVEGSKRFNSLFVEFLRSRDRRAVLAALDDKAKCLFFVQTVQKAIRDALLGAGPIEGLSRLSPFSLLSKFDEALALEGQLRSNANYGLMLETFLTRNFVDE